MKVTYIHHSGFLVETERFYYLFDYESGALPELDAKKPIFVLSSHSHRRHRPGNERQSHHTGRQACGRGDPRAGK